MAENKSNVISEEAKRSAEYYEHTSYSRNGGKTPGLTSFNMEYGFLEARVRGFRSGFLSESEYKGLMQCSTLDEVKLSLTDSDYGQFITGVQRESKDSADTYIKKLYKACQQKFIGEFEYLRMNAVGQLKTFLDFITYEPMIKNFCMLISAIQKGTSADVLLNKLKDTDPIGYYPYLKTIVAFDGADSQNLIIDLFDTLLVDTPVAKYFEQYFMPDDVENEEGHDITRLAREVELGILVDTLQKYVLEDFYNYCRELGGETWEVMRELLGFEADRRVLSITVSSFNTPLNDPACRGNERQQLFPNFGKLYPEAQSIISGTMGGSGIGDYQALQNAFDNKDVKLAHAEVMESKEQDSDAAYNSFTKRLIDKEVDVLKLGFDSQSHFGCFYAFYKLKLRELSNLKLLFTAIAGYEMGGDKKEKDDLLKNFVPIF